MFRTTAIPIITKTSIVEWDMISGNTSIMREFDLLPDKVIRSLEESPKDKRVKKVGILQLKHKGLAKRLEDGFNSIMDDFISINGIASEDIVSIKRDAIFLKCKTPKRSTIGKHCTFIPKNEYVAFLHLNGFEFYMKSNGTFDIKGIPDEKIALHMDGMLDFIKNFLNDFGYDMYGLGQYCKDFISAYKNKELPFDYYRELNGNSLFSIVMSDGASYTTDAITEYDMNDLYIAYNYSKIILPMIRYIL